MARPKYRDIIVGTDYKGQILCRPCWDGNHYFKWKVSRIVGQPPEPVKVIVKNGKGAGVESNCLEGLCQCHCREMMKEVRRVRRDRSKQMTIETDEVFVFDAKNVEPVLAKRQQL